MEYQPTFLPDARGPILREHHVSKESQRLPKFAVSVKSGEKPSEDFGAFPHVIFEGNKYEVISSSGEIADFLFSNTPMLSLLYRMLTHDLSERYGISLFSSQY